MGYLITLFYGIGFIVLIILLFYVFANRIEEKKREDFEKRDN